MTEGTCANTYAAEPSSGSRVSQDRVSLGTALALRAKSRCPGRCAVSSKLGPRRRPAVEVSRPLPLPIRTTVLCPYGFWGIRSLMEEPAFDHAGTLTGRAALVRSAALDPALSERHFTDLRGCL